MVAISTQGFFLEFACISENNAIGIVVNSIYKREILFLKEDTVGLIYVFYQFHFDVMKFYEIWSVLKLPAQPELQKVRISRKKNVK